MNKYCLVSVGILALTGCSKFMPLPIGGTNVINPTSIQPITHAYLLMGQSNMGDRCHDSLPQYKGSPGCSTGEALGLILNDPAAMYVQCAMGGTFLAQWVPGGSLYENCVNSLPKGIPVKGVFFFQGESDAINPLQGTAAWAQGFTGMVNNLRQRLQLPVLPLVFAQIGSGSSSPEWVHIQQEQSSVSIPHVSMVMTADITPFDSVHFDQSGYRTIAARMADAFKTL